MGRDRKERLSAAKERAPADAIVSGLSIRAAAKQLGLDIRLCLRSAADPSWKDKLSDANLRLRIARLGARLRGGNDKQPNGRGP